jgi:hypothetical protein
MPAIERSLYNSPKVILEKSPNYLEKLTCGLIMEENKYKVYMTKNKNPKSGRKSLQLEQILKFDEASNACERFLFPSNMKSYKSKMISNLSPEFQAVVSKANCTLS